MDNVALLSVIFMAVSCAVGFGLPIALFLYLRLRKKADILPFFVGCAVMLIFAFLLEQLAHRLILGTDTGQAIQNNR